jgi:hypothetical protein
MVLHWEGGDHTAFALPKNKTGEHRWKTDIDTVQLIAALARQMPDYSIAAMLNRLSKRTAKGHTWTAARIRTLRSDHRIDVYRDGERAQRAEVNLDEAAKELGVSVVIGPLPQIAPKKHCVPRPCHRHGKVDGGAAEDRSGNGAQCPRVSVVLGDVIDIGESVWRFVAAGPISRLRE